MTDYEKLSDRELDAEVAEKVIGWTWEIDESTDGGEKMWYRPDDQQWFYQPPHYSTDIAAAFEVLDKLRSINDSLDWQLSRYSENDLYNCNLNWLSDQGEHDLEAKAHTAPRAICLAALRAVEGK